MKRTLLFLILTLSMVFILTGCLKAPVNFTNVDDDKTNQSTADLGGFCGSSTKDQCQTSADCVGGGCSGQVCEKVGKGTVTTCEYVDCYDKTKYGVTCGCVSGQCQWYK